MGAMKEAGFKETRKSITNRQNMVAQYISARPLLELCEWTKHKGGGKVVQEVVGPKRNRLGNSEVTGSGDRLRVGRGDR